MIRLVELIAGDQALARRTDENWIEIPAAVIARAGVLEYQRGDGSIIRELRDPSVIHSADSLASYEGRPVLLGKHPTNAAGQVVLADEENTARLPVIGSLRNVRAGKSTDGDGVEHAVTLADVLIWHKDGINAANNGIRQFSAGYKTSVGLESGTFDGIEFDARQLEDIGNHVVLTPNARAGDVTEFRMDAADAVCFNAATAANHKRGDMEDTTELQAEIERLNAENAALRAEIAKALEDKEELRGQLAAMRAQAETEEPAGDMSEDKDKDKDKSNGDYQRGDAADLDRLVEQRLELIDAARRLVGPAYSYAGKQATEIRADTITAAIPDLSLEGLTEAEIRGAYIVALRSGSGSQQLAAATRGDAAPMPTPRSSVEHARRAHYAWYTNKTTKTEG